MTNKKIIEQRFSRSINTYPQHATVQLHIVKKLNTHIKNLSFHKSPFVLEIGCGTGLLTNEFLQFHRPEIFYVNDISIEAMTAIASVFEKHAFPNWQFIIGDAENTHFPDHLDLIISSSTLQWFTDLERFIEKIYCNLNEDGYFVFSTYGPDNYKEVKTVAGIGLQYYSIPDLLQILHKYFNILHIEEEHQVLYFQNPIKVLQHIKYTGVNSINKQFWTKGKLKNFENEYQKQYSTPQNEVMLTYHPIYVVLQKNQLI